MRMLIIKLIPGNKNTKASNLFDKELFFLKNNRKKTKTKSKDEKAFISNISISMVYLVIKLTKIDSYIYNYKLYYIQKQEENETLRHLINKSPIGNESIVLRQDLQ